MISALDLQDGLTGVCLGVMRRRDAPKTLASPHRNPTACVGLATQHHLGHEGAQYDG
jgi:hypothetical protein